MRIARWSVPLFGALALSVAFSPGRAAAQAGGLVNQTAPDFTLPMLSGGTGSVSQLKGKVVLLNFFASW